MVDTDGACRRLRADAERNRARILEAAREVFAESGLDAPLEEVARRACVGVGTLYRRFPTRADLVDAVFEAKMEAYADAVEQALADPDPWRGFRGYVEQVCAMQARDRGFTQVLTLTFPIGRTLDRTRGRAGAGFAELVDRAKAAGALRADFVPEDLPLLLMANAGVVAATADFAPDAWRRVVAYLLQAFAARAADQAEPLPPAPSRAGIHRAVVRLRRAARVPVGRGRGRGVGLAEPGGGP